jgi:hypothetical protein
MIHVLTWVLIGCAVFNVLLLPIYGRMLGWW